MTLQEKREADRLRRKALVKIFENLTARQQRVWDDDFEYMLADAIKGLELVCSAAEAELYDEDGNRLEVDPEHAEAVAMLEEVDRVGEELLQPLYALEEFRRAMAAALLEAENEETRRTPFQESPQQKAEWLKAVQAKMPIGTSVKVLKYDIKAFVGRTGRVAGYDTGLDGEWPTVRLKFEAGDEELEQDGFYDDELELM